ncbi:amidase [Tomitella fengzijianii]|uniref:Amidase n=1 Tax=Tomitella fengzijianii TaxID=2597660 RepID=A0A516WZW5_9ACTN|nr:amidase [Tomitella fengzijianii]QDQ96394.1 amidase [Tomitella fengzijianii]
MSLRELATALARKEVTVTAHVEQVLSALDGLAGTPWENLVPARRDDAALAEAALLDTEIAADRWRSPLHGVAVAVKDNIDVAGMPTRCGSAALADAPPAERDADIVARLREAGAIVVAKSHLHEFAYGCTGEENADGPAANPHDPSRITGGSSSGSAALVARKAVPLAVGTDTGCSVRTPGALCGVVGLMPGAASLPTRGAFPLSTTLDHIGLLTGDVVDAGLAWGAIPGVARTPWPVAGMRVGRLRGAAFETHDPVIGDAVDRACTALTEAGAEVVDVELPHAEELSAAYPVIVGSEAYETHTDPRGGLPAGAIDRYTPGVAGRVRAQADRPAVEYLRALRSVRRMRDEALHTLRHDHGLSGLVCATTPIRATPVGQDTTTRADGRAGLSVRSELLRMCIPFSMLGVPAVSVPAPDAPGLPAGIQLAGLGVPPGGERIPGTHPAEAIALGLGLAAGG